MNFPVKTIGFLLVYPVFWLLDKCFSGSYPHVLDSENTLKQLIKSKKSLARFGDGELNLLTGKTIGFQNANPKLAKRLCYVLEHPTSECYIGIPDVFKNRSRLKLDSKCFWLYSTVRNWIRWRKHLSAKSKYLDSLCSRFYIIHKNKAESNKILQLWKEIWHDRDLVIVEGEKTKMGVGNNLFDNARSINRIICPSKNAFDKYDEILKVSLSVDSKKLFLIALGPTASILSYDLANRGYQAIDTGHLDLEYNWYIMNSRNKEAVPGRLVNEISENVMVEVTDSMYDSQIIAHIR